MVESYLKYKRTCSQKGVLILALVMLARIAIIDTEPIPFKTRSYRRLFLPSARFPTHPTLVSITISHATKIVLCRGGYIALG